MKYSPCKGMVLKTPICIFGAAYLFLVSCKLLRLCDSAVGEAVGAVGPKTCVWRHMGQLSPTPRELALALTLAASWRHAFRDSVQAGRPIFLGATL